MAHNSSGRRSAKKHKVLKAITFVGRLDHEETSCNCCIPPTRRAGLATTSLGIVALEADATGCPVVTANVGGLGEAPFITADGHVHVPADVAGLERRARPCSMIAIRRSGRAIAARDRLPPTSMHIQSRARASTRTGLCFVSQLSANANRHRAAPSSSNRTARPLASSNRRRIFRA